MDTWLYKAKPIILCPDVQFTEKTYDYCHYHIIITLLSSGRDFCIGFFDLFGCIDTEILLWL